MQVQQNLDMFWDVFSFFFDLSDDICSVQRSVVCAFPFNGPKNLGHLLVNFSSLSLSSVVYKHPFGKNNLKLQRYLSETRH
jgi:hypothetical protein